GAPAQTTGTFTDPGVFFTVPCEWMARDHTGKSITVRSAPARTAVSMTRPTTPRDRADTASRSPNIPSVDSETVVTTRMSTAVHCSIAAWIIRLSPGG